jgi:hypothetical protein
VSAQGPAATEHTSFAAKGKLIVLSRSRCWEDFIPLKKRGYVYVDAYIRNVGTAPERATASGTLFYSDRKQQAWAANSSPVVRPGQTRKVGAAVQYTQLTHDLVRCNCYPSFEDALQALKDGRVAPTYRIRVGKRVVG